MPSSPKSGQSKSSLAKSPPSCTIKLTLQGMTSRRDYSGELAIKWSFACIYCLRITKWCVSRLYDAFSFVCISILALNHGSNSVDFYMLIHLYNALLLATLRSSFFISSLSLLRWKQAITALYRSSVWSYHMKSFLSLLLTNIKENTYSPCIYLSQRKSR